MTEVDWLCHLDFTSEQDSNFFTAESNWAKLAVASLSEHISGVGRLQLTTKSNG